jgi:hypothetical protein
VTAARPLPRYGANGKRARSRPCSRQLHHHNGHDRAVAFPGAFVTIWCGLKGWSKERQRALYQPFILLTQVAALLLIVLAHPATGDRLSVSVEFAVHAANAVGNEAGADVVSPSERRSLRDDRQPAAYCFRAQLAFLGSNPMSALRRPVGSAACTARFIPPFTQQFRQRHFKWFPVCLQAALINLAAKRIAASSGCGEAAVSR